MPHASQTSDVAFVRSDLFRWTMDDGRHDDGSECLNVHIADSIMTTRKRFSPGGVIHDEHA
eukprot:scaffold12147_cov318-Chaetoceros_neogracile.AAC.2